MTAAQGWALLAGEQRTTSSPAWLVPVDDFRRVRSARGVSAALDVWDAAGWRTTEVRATRTPGGVIAYPGLNRRVWPFDPQSQLFRCRLAAPGRYPLVLGAGGNFWADLVGIEFLAHPFDDDHPPEQVGQAVVVPMLPGPTYAFPPGTRVVRGTVRDGVTGRPVPNALVQAGGTSDPDLVPWTERSLSGPDGAFALALRFQGVHEVGGEAFDLTATESPDRSGALHVHVTDEPLGLLVIEIS
ncbi:carboxypeptidase regulatory-like domain-containing protein [Modestobacter excelsi]|uniref:carboxypeptidase regulatory-like domain-containing protein n=1 Tax=Modestobacter excelsi TaxID=2213161 RepID=UPI00110CA92A|nr:carboxypeptidase regulatory-like domain-containing protein [Modestobacter excelsi]